MLEVLLTETGTEDLSRDIPPLDGVDSVVVEVASAVFALVDENLCFMARCMSGEICFCGL